MAYKFRVEPLSFELPSSLYNEFKNNSSVESVHYIFGYAILFTVDKKKKIKNTEKIHPVRFEKFSTTFINFVNSLSTSERSLARAEFNRKNRIGAFARCGYYDRKGNWLRSYPLDEEKILVFDDEAAAEKHLAGVMSVVDAGERARQRSDAFNKINQNAEQTQQETVKKDQKHSENFEKGKNTEAGQQEKEEKKKKDERERGREEESTARDSNFKRNFSSESQKQSGKAAEFTKEQGEKIAAMASVLQPVGTGLSAVGRFDLHTLQRDKRFKETHVPVRRGDYAGVTRNIVRGQRGGYVITGPTGCGKSTVALLPLFEEEKSNTLVVEPTQANAANILHEFTNILPNMVASGIIGGKVPVTRFVAPTVTQPPYPQLSVTTTDKLLEYLYYEGRFPKFDYVVIDEFHLPIPSMVRVVELIRAFELTPKYVFVSATAVGFSVSPQLPRAVTQIYGNLPLGEFPARMERSDLDPRRWFKVGDGTVGVVTPSVVMAKRLHKTYREWGLRAFLVTRETVVSTYMKAATDYASMTVFVLEPGVEAGVTLSLSVLLSMGTTAAVRYDGKVVLEDSQPLDEIAAIQRGGRGGRVKPTLYVTPRAPTEVKSGSTADYFRAQAVIIAVAMGAEVSSLRVSDLLRQFPKLGSLTKKYATRAVHAGGDPFLAVYKTSPDGNIYKECGGSGTGFQELARSELFVYHYDGGFFVAPIADFSDLNSRPDTFVVRDHQFDAAGQIVSCIPGLEAKYDLEDLVAMMVGKFDHYVSDLFTRLRRIFDKPEPTQYTVGSDRPAEVADFLSSSPPLVKLFEYLKTEPVGVSYKREVVTNSGKMWSKHSFVHSSGTLNFAFSEKYMKKDSGTVDVAKLAEDVLKSLRGLLCIEILLDGAPDRCVDLRSYKGRIPVEHVWYSREVLGR